MQTVKQHDTKDCGACCLLAIIKYYKGNVPLEKVRLDAKVTSRGTSALNLIEASKKYGFEAMGVKVDNLQQDNIKLPAIAHIITKNGLEHFVVIYKIKSSVLYIMDPAKGKIIMKTSEFNKLWDHVLLLFYPKMPIIFMKSNNSLLTLFLKIIGKQKTLFLSIIITSSILCFLTIINSFYLKVVVEAINEGCDLSYIYFWLIVFSFLLLFKLLFSNMRKVLENHLNKNIDTLLLAQFIEHIFHLPLSSIEARTSGEIMTRVGEVLNIKSLFTDIFINTFLDLFLALSIMPILYIINISLLKIILLFLIIYFLINLGINKIVYKKAYQNIELEAEFNTTLLEALNMLVSLKNLQKVKIALQKIEEKLSNYLYDNFKVVQFLNNQNNLKIWLNEIGLFLINGLGFILIYQNKLSLTNLITFNTLLTFFLEPLKHIMDTIPKLLFIKASFTKINEFLSIEEEKEGNSKYLDNYDLEITSLKYSYNNYDLVINNLNVEIKMGEVVLLKGASGTGKSTLCKILTKSIVDYQGNILIANYNLKDYSLAVIRNNITYVSQRESLCTGTIKDNICLGKMVDEKRFLEVCRICHIENIVSSKPLRYNTIINNESSFISGGERQRIILARALMEDANIYLIDEALSEVDYALERSILNNLFIFLKGKTIIYITHKNQDDLFKHILYLEAKNGL